MRRIFSSVLLIATFVVWHRISAEVHAGNQLIKSHSPIQGLSDPSSKHAVGYDSLLKKKFNRFKENQDLPVDVVVAHPLLEQSFIFSCSFFALPANPKIFRSLRAPPVFV